LKFLFSAQFKASDIKLFPLWEGGKPAADFAPISLALPVRDFKGKEGDTSLCFDGEERCLLVGLGKQDKANVEGLRRAYSKAVQRILTMGYKHIEVLFPDCKQKAEFLRGIAEGIALSNYQFSYKSEKPNPLIETVTIVGASKSALTDEILIVAEGVHFVRNLVNSNADDKIEKLIASAEKLHPEVTTTVFDKKFLVKEKMGLILAVNRASSKEPVLLKSSYRGNPKAKDHIVLVGKGITYDTGGLSLKPTDNMLSMKSDMSGAATVLAAVKTAAALGLKVNVTALAPLTENCIGSKSYKLGDVYTSYFGKTVEINNTDAEGRLVLADALSYAAKHLKPTFMVDLATLTGACVIALGEEIAGFFTPDDNLAEALLHASQLTDELLWRLPLHDEYKKHLKSEIADMVNAGPRWAGSITAALFLKEFTQDIPWAHIDIAGPAFLSKPQFYCSSSATGYGVRLLVELLKRKLS